MSENDETYAREELSDESDDEILDAPLVRLTQKPVESDSSSDEESEEEPPRFVVLPTASSSRAGLSSEQMIDAVPYSNVAASKFGKDRTEWKTRPITESAKASQPILRRGYGKSKPNKFIASIVLRVIILE